MVLGHSTCLSPDAATNSDAAVSLFKDAPLLDRLRWHRSWISTAGSTAQLLAELGSSATDIGS